MKRFENENRVSAEQQRWLTFGAVLMYSNFESSRTFTMINQRHGIESLKRGFENSWGISNGNEALLMLNKLSIANVHSADARKFFERHIKPIIDDEEKFKELAKEDEAINDYYKARNDLIYKHYTNDEISAISRFEAWDLGRVVFIARSSVCLGYLDENEVWPYIKKAADKASEIYSSWKEYLAAYYLGRAVAYGYNDSPITAIDYLLSNKNSPYNESIFSVKPDSKNGYKKIKKLVSSLLTEEQFWEIIEKSNKGNDLKAELSKLSKEEIFGYKYWWDYFHMESYNQALWAVAYTVLGGCSDDGFDYFRYWLVTRGKDVYKKAIQDADSLCNEFEDVADGEYPEWEEIAYAPMEVFEEKWDKDFYDAEDEAQESIEFIDTPRPQLIFEWNEGDEASIKAVCPKTFKKWWGNDKFLT